ncbi:MAG: EAL domain-containing protein [Magnetospirillum sp.]
MTHVLYVDIRGLNDLRAAMGETVAGNALAELQDRLPRMLGPVLARLGGFDPLTTSRPGRWCVGVTCADDEAAEVTRQAAQRLTHDLAAEIFGAATGALAKVMAELAPRQPGDLDDLLDDHAALVPADETCQLRAQVQDLLDQGGLRTLLQPIVSFPDGKVVGYEALSRGPVGHPLERADLLFGAAARTGLSHDLECACARLALPWLEKLPAGRWMTVNASVPVLLDAEMRRALARPGLVVEITEHLPIAPEGLLPALDELRQGGARIALDDTGCGFADTAAAELVRPTVVKLCITVIRGAGRDPSILPEVHATVRAFQSLGAEVLAEGVEDQIQADALDGLGINLAQGWLYGRPQPATDFL